ncbi:MAG: hypothetical protein PHR44_00800 [Candidatus Omnitrophica bacterium]|nr:hypothetical protein [Candidatus Omnitrophota bacterium]
MNRSKTVNIIILTLLFSASAFWFIHPVLLKGIHNNGRGDWDEHFFYHESARKAIVEYRQFPLWNPYDSGGTPLLGNPQARFLSPTFLLETMFGTIVGLKLEVFLHFLIGLSGMYLFARHCSVSTQAALFASLVFMFNGLFAAHIAAGHSWILPYAYIPYVVLFYDKSIEAEGAKRFRNLLYAALFVLLMLFGGGIYPLPLLIIFMSFYALASAIVGRKARYVINLFAVFILAFALGAVKALPTIEALARVPRYTPGEFVDLNLYGLIYKFFGRAHHFSWPGKVFEGQNIFWHEHVSYIGILPFVFFLLGMRGAWKSRQPLVISSFFLFLIALGGRPEFSPWHIMHNLPFFNCLRVESRATMLFLFGLALICAQGVDYFKRYIRRWGRFASLILPLALLAVYCDLYAVNAQFFKGVFSKRPPVVVFSAKGPARWSPDYEPLGKRKPSLEALMNNRGTFITANYIHPPVRALAYTDLSYRGEIYLLNSHGTVEIRRWSPNTLKLYLQGISGTDIVVINQNFYPGWRVSGIDSSVRPHNGLISFSVGRQDAGKEVVLTFLPFSFIAGCASSILALAFSLYFLTRRPFNRSKAIC